MLFGKKNKDKGMGRIAKSVEAALKEINFTYDYDESRNVFIFGCGSGGRIGNLQFAIGCNEELNRAEFRASAPIRVDVDDAAQTDAMIDLINRLNYSMISGAFKLDLSDGELVFHLAIIYDNVDVIPTRMSINGIAVPVQMWSHNGEAFLGVLFGGLSAEEAYEKVQ